jgi:hypothetical protein
MPTGKIVFVTLCIFTLFALSSSISEGYAYSGSSAAATAPSSLGGCNIQTLRQESFAETHSINTAAATSFAAHSKVYSLLASQFPALSQSSSSIFYTWSNDFSTCGPTLASVNVAFFLTANDQAGHVISISMNPSLTAVIGNSSYPEQMNQNYQQTWSGYEFSMYNSNSQQQLVTDNQMKWNVPSVQIPPSSQGVNCKSKPCVLSVWNGLSNSPGGGGGLVQTGTQGEISYSCFILCSYSYSYEAWYEDYPNYGTVKCFSVSAGDGIASDVYLAIDGYGNYMPSTYLLDGTSQNSCGTNYLTNEATYYGQYMYERNANANTGIPNSLPEFDSGDTDTILGMIAGANSCSSSGCPYNDVSIYNPYLSGYYTQDEMKNSGTLNINLGNVNYDGSWGSFTEQWQSSAGT